MAIQAAHCYVKETQISKKQKVKSLMIVMSHGTSHSTERSTKSQSIPLTKPHASNKPARPKERNHNRDPYSYKLLQ